MRNGDSEGQLFFEMLACQGKKRVEARGKEQNQGMFICFRIRQT